MTKEEDEIRMIRSISKIGKTAVKVKISFILCLALIVVIIIATVSFQLGWFAPIDVGEDNGELPNYEPTISRFAPNTPVLDPIIPNPNTNGWVELSWDEPEWLAYFRIWRKKDDESWKLIATGIFMETSYIDTLTENGEYKYVMIAYLVRYESNYSNIETVLTNIPIPPTNPSIIINNGAETTDSYNVELTLYCNDADEMRFQIKEGYWTDYVDYATTYPITLFEDDPLSPDYRVGVEFKNIYGTIETWDGITYDPEEIIPEDDDEEDYILLTIVLILILGSLIGIVIFMKVRKKKTTYQRRIKYFDKKDKKRNSK